MRLRPKVLAPEAGALTFGPGGDRYLTKLSGADTGGAFALVEITIAPGGGPPLHRHAQEDEVFVVLEGEVSFWLDDRAVEAPVGSVVFGARGVAHTFKNRSSAPVRMMVWLAPPTAEEFFRRFCEVPAGSSTPLPDELIVERILKLAPEYGIEILGPSPL